MGKRQKRNPGGLECAKPAFKASDDSLQNSLKQVWQWLGDKLNP
jgi:hypothetical protein